MHTNTEIYKERDSQRPEETKETIKTMETHGDELAILWNYSA